MNTEIMVTDIENCSTFYEQHGLSLSKTVNELIFRGKKSIEVVDSNQQEKTPKEEFHVTGLSNSKGTNHNISGPEISEQYNKKMYDETINSRKQQHRHSERFLFKRNSEMRCNRNNGLMNATWEPNSSETRPIKTHTVKNLAKLSIKQGLDLLK